MSPLSEVVLLLPERSKLCAAKDSDLPKLAVDAVQQLFPQRGAVVAEKNRRVGLGHVPEARLELLGELARLPADETDEVARLVRAVLDDAVDRRAVAGHE